MSPRIGLDMPTLLHAAAALADEQGLDRVTLASLAQRLTIRSPSLYNHIDGLTELRSKLAVYGMEQLFGRMKEAADGHAGAEAIRALGIAYVRFARTRPGLYDAIVRLPSLREPEAAQAADRIVRLVLDAVAGYGLTGDAAIHAVRGLRSLLHGFASLEQGGGFGIPLDRNASLEWLLDAYIMGIDAKSNQRISKEPGGA